MYYANEGKRLIDTYTNHVSGDKDEYGIWSVYGHAHSQQCNGYHRDTKSGEVVVEDVVLKIIILRDFM